MINKNDKNSVEWYPKKGVDTEAPVARFVWMLEKYVWFH